MSAIATELDAFLWDLRIFGWLPRFAAAAGSQTKSDFNYRGPPGSQANALVWQPREAVARPPQW
jgi:hypothetical protein